MKTIYQIYINGIPSKHVFSNEIDANTLVERIAPMYKHVSIESFSVPTKD